MRSQGSRNRDHSPGLEAVARRSAEMEFGCVQLHGMAVPGPITCSLSALMMSHRVPISDRLPEGGYPPLLAPKRLRHPRSAPNTDNDVQATCTLIVFNTQKAKTARIFLLRVLRFGPLDVPMTVEGIFQAQEPKCWPSGSNAVVTRAPTLGSKPLVPPPTFPLLAGRHKFGAYSLTASNAHLQEPKELRPSESTVILPSDA